MGKLKLELIIEGVPEELLKTLGNYFVIELANVAGNKLPGSLVSLLTECTTIVSEVSVLDFSQAGNDFKARLFLFRYPLSDEDTRDTNDEEDKLSYTLTYPATPVSLEVDPYTMTTAPSTILNPLNNELD